MPLQTSGAISLNDIHVEAGGTSGTQASINDSDIRGLISRASGAQMSFSEWYGASSYTSPSIPTTAIATLTANGNSALQINDGVNTQTYTTTSTASYTKTATFDTAVGRDLVITFMIRDRDSTDIDRFYFSENNTSSNNIVRGIALTALNGATLGSYVQRTNINDTIFAATGQTFNANAVLFDSIRGDAGETYQCSIKITNIDAAQISATTEFRFQHEDNEDDSNYNRMWEIKLT